MWSCGCPAGFCDKDAFGFPVKNSKYDGYIPALACPIHGGPPSPNSEEYDDQEDYDADCDHYNTYGWSASH